MGCFTQAFIGEISDPVGGAGHEAVDQKNNSLVSRLVSRRVYSAWNALTTEDVAVFRHDVMVFLWVALISNQLRLK